MTDRNRTYQNGKVSTHVQRESFSGRGNACIKLLFLFIFISTKLLFLFLFSGHIANKFRRATIFQLNIEGLTASKMNVFYCLSLQSEALIILLQETHCTDAKKSVLPSYQLAESSLSRKHGLATFVHERLRYLLLDQSPLTSEIKWLCVDVDGYKIINVYKPPTTRLRSLDVPFFLTPIFTLAILTVVMLIGVTMITIRTVSAWLAGQVLIVLPSYTMARTLPVFTPAAGTLAPIQI